MKSALIVFLVILAVILGFSLYSLQKELLSVKDNAAFCKKRSDELYGELTRINRAHDEKERFLKEIQQSVTELESKVKLETLERHIPQETWAEIKPIIDRLKAFQESGIYQAEMAPEGTKKP